MEIDIDKMIAKHVMGFDKDDAKYYDYHCTGNVKFSPSTNMNHALIVMDKLKEFGFSTLLRDCANQDCGLVKNEVATREDYYCNVSHGTVYSDKLRFKSVSNSPHMAVCLSALKAVGVIAND